MRDVKTWSNELFDEIRLISNTNQLRNLWLGKEKNKISSFIEEISHIFDDYDIDNFIKESRKNKWLNSNQIISLTSFRNQFDDYIKSLRKPISEIHPEEILDDPAWLNISASAANFIETLNKK